MGTEGGVDAVVGARGGGGGGTEACERGDLEEYIRAVSPAPLAAPAAAMIAKVALDIVE